MPLRGLATALYGHTIITIARCKAPSQLQTSGGTTSSSGTSRPRSTFGRRPIVADSPHPSSRRSSSSSRPPTAPSLVSRSSHDGAHYRRGLLGSASATETGASHLASLSLAWQLSDRASIMCRQTQSRTSAASCSCSPCFFHAKLGFRNQPIGAIGRCRVPSMI